MTEGADDIRRAAAALSARERQAMRCQADTAAEKWSDLLPRVGAFWATVAALLADVEQLDRARRAAEQ